MSAINPASFQTPTSSLGLTAAPAQHFPAPEGLGGRGRGYDSRRHMGPMSYEGQYGDAEPPPMRGGFMAPNYPSFNPGMQGPPPGMGPFVNNMQMDPFGDYYQPSYGMLNPNAANFATGRPGLGSRQSNQSPGNDWTGRFQGLSLGS